VIAAAVTASKFSNFLLIVARKPFAAKLLASVVAAVNIIATRFVPIASTPIPCCAACNKWRDELRVEDINGRAGETLI